MTSTNGINSGKLLLEKNVCFGQKWTFILKSSKLK